MARRGYLTGDTVTATDYICRRLLIPNDLDLILAVNGAITELTRVHNWEQFGAATVNETVALMDDMLELFYYSDACMIGAILPYVSTDPPPATLACDGTQYQRADYPSLYAVLNAALIVDSDNFVTPDLRGQFLFGADGSRIPLDTGGTETHTLTEAELPSHTHTSPPHTHSYNASTPLVDAVGAVPEPSAITLPSLTGATAVTINPSGGGGAHNNMPPFTAMNYCIVAR